MDYRRLEDSPSDRQIQDEKSYCKLTYKRKYERIPQQKLLSIYAYNQAE